MSSPGLGVMIQQLFNSGEDTKQAFAALTSAKIKSVVLKDDVLLFSLDNGKTVAVFDGGQSCCEHRYLVCDDDLPSFTGSTVVDVLVRDAPNVEDEYGEHEVQFLAVKTDTGEITVSAHNEHSGYYGGFALQMALR